MAGSPKDVTIFHDPNLAGVSNELLEQVKDELRQHLKSCPDHAEPFMSGDGQFVFIRTSRSTWHLAATAEAS